MSEIWTRPRKSEEPPIIDREISFVPEFTTMALKGDLDEFPPKNLYLIATKKNNSKTHLGQFPTDDGYLYLDEDMQQLYYSSIVYDEPKYLCDWDASIASGLDCQNFHATITKDGDIIFLRRGQKSLVRTNPIIYPAGDYDNPKVIDFGTETKPFGWQRDVNVTHHPTGDYFMFGEYRGWNQADDGTELYVWKVTKPYDDPNSWKRVLTCHFVDYRTGYGNFPDTEIGHFHTCQYDFFSKAWIATTGDVGHQNRIFISKDDGETWVDQNLGGGKTIRLTGFVFLEDYVWYQTDDAGTHELYKVPRDSQGYPDFANKIKVVGLTHSQAGYLTIYVREPNGLLLLDRAEPRPDNKIDLNFYSFEYEKLFHLGTFDRIDNGDKYEGPGRHGFPIYASTHYQSIYEDGIIVGGNTLTKPFTVKVLGNNDGNILGVLKIKIIRA